MFIKLKKILSHLQLLLRVAGWNMKHTHSVNRSKISIIVIGFALNTVGVTIHL